MTRVRFAFLLGATAIGLALPGAAWAQSEDRLSADVSATAGYSNNPFAILGKDTGSGLLSVNITPQYRHLTERSTITVSAEADLQQYFRRYGHNESYSGAIDYASRPTERLNTHVRLDLSSQVLGAFGGYAPIDAGGGIGGIGAVGLTDTGVTGGATGVGTTLPVIVTPASLVPITDIGLYGLRNRRRTARLNGDAGLVLSARDSLNFSAYSEVTRYSNLKSGNYEAYSGTIGYSRRISDRLNAGLQGSASSFNYRSGISNSRSYSIQATGSGRINERWTADGALGVSFVDGGNGVSTGSTSLSGNVDLCRRGPLTSMCLQAARAVSPTGLSGSQYVTTAGGNWSKRIAEHESVSLSGTYSTVGGSDTRLAGNVVPILQTQYVQAVAGYNRQLRERLSLVASVNYRQLLGNDVDRPKDFGGQVGLSYRIGDTH
jgi:hypothetical protein